MSSVDKMLFNQLSAVAYAKQVRTDSPVAIRIRHLTADAVTSVTVTTATNIVLIDAVGSVTSTFASDTTLGAVCNTINASGRWEAKVLDSLRSDASASRLLDGAITAGLVDSFPVNGILVWDAKLDTSAALCFAVCASVDRGFRLQDDVLGTRVQHRVKIKKLSYAINMGTAADNSVLLVKRDINGVETNILSNLSVDTTATTVFNGYGDPQGYLGFEVGFEYVFKVLDAATLADSTSNIMEVDYLVE